MIAEKAALTSMSRHKHHIAFFRQSGWMLAATTFTGALMYAVHMVARRMPKDEYGLFTTLLQVTALMTIPAIGLQGVFMQQAAASLNPEHEKELAGVFRGVLRGTFIVWLLMAAAIWLLGQCSVFLRNREQLAEPPMGLVLDDAAVTWLAEAISRWAAGGLARRA